MHIKRFIDKVAHMENRSSKDLIMPMAEAKSLRDELAKLMADNLRLLQDQPKTQETLQVEIVGGKF